MANPHEMRNGGEGSVEKVWLKLKEVEYGKKAQEWNTEDIHTHKPTEPEREEEKDSGEVVWVRRGFVRGRRERNC